MGLTWERMKITLSCGCEAHRENPDFKWDAFYPGDDWWCAKHGKEQTIKRMSRVTQK